MLYSYLSLKVSINIMSYQFSLYILQQFISRLLYMKVYLYSPLFVLFILLSGIIAGLNPCTVSILPLLWSDLALNDKRYIEGLIFVFGLLSMESFIGCLVSIIGYRYYIVSITLPVLSSIFLIFIGLFLLRIVSFNIQSFLFNSNVSYLSNIYLKNFVLGTIFGINTLPCNLPIFLTVFSILLDFNNFVLLLLYSLIYIVGYILPLLFAYLLSQKIKSFKWFKIFIFSKLYVLLGGSYFLSSGVFEFLKVCFYSLY